MRWQDQFKRGDRVEVNAVFADGSKRWIPARIWRVTPSGRAFNVVVGGKDLGRGVVMGGYWLTIDRKNDIRKPQAPNTEQN